MILCQHVFGLGGVAWRDSERMRPQHKCGHKSGYLPGPGTLTQKLRTSTSLNFPISARVDHTRSHVTQHLMLTCAAFNEGFFAANLNYNKTQGT